MLLLELDLLLLELEPDLLLLELDLLLQEDLEEDLLLLRLLDPLYVLFSDIASSSERQSSIYEQ